MKSAGVLVTLIAAAATLAAQNGAVTVVVDVAASRRAIDPNIYGVAYATTAQLTDLNVPLNRSAATTRPATTGRSTPTIAPGLVLREHRRSRRHGRPARRRLHHVGEGRRAPSR